ncbi:MAG: hypothetical protein AB1598_01300 [Thermodesulfobacteriota bacterium]
MMRFMHISLCTAVFILFTGAAHAELYGVAQEAEHRSAETEAPRINGFGESSLYSIDPDTGAATLIGPTGFYFCRGMDFQPRTNVLYAVCFDGTDDQVLIIIDILSGQGTLVGLLNAEGLLHDLSFRGDGTLFGYFIAKPGNFLATIDVHTGDTNFIGFSGLNGDGNGIGFDQFNDLFLTDTDFVTFLPSLYLLNQSSGIANLITDLTLPPLEKGLTVINSLDLNPETNVMFGSLDVVTLVYDNYLVTIDTETGVVTNVGETVEGLEAIAFLNTQLSAIPTLSEYGMAAVSLALLSIALFVLYRRKKVIAD